MALCLLRTQKSRQKHPGKLPYFPGPVGKHSVLPGEVGLCGFKAWALQTPDMLGLNPGYLLPVWPQTGGLTSVPQFHPL